MQHVAPAGNRVTSTVCAMHLNQQNCVTVAGTVILGFCLEHVALEVAFSFNDCTDN